MAKNQNPNQNQPPVDENELIKVRHDKMAAFRDKGVEPFGHAYEVTHHAEDVRREYGDLEGENEGG